MYPEHNVMCGLRDINGNGVVTGLTEVSRIKAKETAPDGSEIPCKGELFYRGINVRDLVAGFRKDNRFGFEEIAYLLLMGDLPDKAQLAEFKSVLSGLGTLPTNFVRDVVMTRFAQ